MGSASSGGGDFERVVRVLMRFGLDEQSANQVRQALDAQDNDLQDLQKQWELLRVQSGLTEADTVKAIQGSITGMKLQEQQILAIGRAYEAQRTASQSAAAAKEVEAAADKEQQELLKEYIGQRRSELKAEASENSANLKQIAKSFSDTISAGRMLSEIGRAGTIFGGLLNNDDMKRIGQATTGVGELVMVVGRFKQLLLDMPSLGSTLGLVGAIGGGIAAGAGLYDRFRPAGTADAGTIVKQTLSSAGAGLAAVFASTNDKAEVYRKTLDDTAHMYGLISDETYDASRVQYDAAARAEQANKKFAESIDHTAISAQEAAAGLKFFGNVLSGLGLKQAGQAVSAGLEVTPAFKDAAKEFESYQEKLAKIEKDGGEKRIEIEQDTADRLTELTTKYTSDNARIYQDFVDANQKAADDLKRQQMKIAQSGVDDEQREEAKYYRDRVKAAAKFGLEMLRMEQDHQVEMQRMQEDHGIRLRKLAEARDALGMVDEQESYEVERRRKEQDHQKEVGRRNEDYALQLAEQDQAFHDQRQQRADDRAQRLAELQAEFQAQAAERQKNYSKAAMEREKNFSDELNKTKQEGAKKLSDLAQQMTDERTQANDEWMTWRREHEIFFAGEKQLWDDYLKYTYDQLNAYLTKGEAPGRTGTYTPQHYQEGGYSAGGLSRLHANEYILNPRTTAALEKAAGGMLTQSKVLAMLGKGGGGVGSISITQHFSGQQSDPATYKSIMYEVIADVMNRASR